MAQASITITRSAGADGAVLVFIDGEFYDGIRVVLNDHGIFQTVDFEHSDTERSSTFATLTCEIPTYSA